MVVWCLLPSAFYAKTFFSYREPDSRGPSKNESIKQGNVFNESQNRVLENGARWTS